MPALPAKSKSHHSSSVAARYSYGCHLQMPTSCCLHCKQHLTPGLEGPEECDVISESIAVLNCTHKLGHGLVFKGVLPYLHRASYVASHTDHPNCTLSIHRQTRHSRTPPPAMVRERASEQICLQSRVESRKYKHELSRAMSWKPWPIPRLQLRR